MALGSSFAAGPALGPVADAVSMRSSRNYAHLLAAHLGARLVVGSDEPWAHGFDPAPERMAGSFHPNHAGMRAVADEVACVLRD